MVIFLYGPDDYRRHRKKAEIIAEFRKKHPDIGPAPFDLAVRDDLDQLAAFTRNVSIFEGAQFAVVENAFEAEAARLAKILKPALATKGMQLLISERDKPVKVLSFLTEKPTLSQKFEKLAGAEWAAFIRTEAKARGIALAPPAVQFIAGVYDGDSWALATELDKLSTLKTDIGRADLDQLDLEIAPNYWALVMGLKSSDMKSRLAALETLLSANDPPAKIFNIVAAQAQEKTPHMAEYDAAVKSGKVDYEEALLDFVIS